jgi:hypothetical protein
VDRLDALKGEVDDIGLSMARLEGRVEQAVTWPKLVAILGGMAGAVVTVAWLIVSTYSGRGEAALSSATKKFDDDGRQLRTETNATLQRIEAKVDAQNRVILEQRPRAEAKQELEMRTGEKRPSR